MKKIFIVFSLIGSLFSNGQEIKQSKLLDFAPLFRFGFQLPVHTGNNFFNNDLTSGFGFHSNISLVRIYQFRLGVGYEFQQLGMANPEAIGNFESVNFNAYYYFLEFEIPIEPKFQINPTLSYGETNLNYKQLQGGNTLAKQSMEEIRLGGYATYYLNRTFSIYSGLHFSHIFNGDLNASPENKDYFGKGNKIILSIGIEIH